MKSKRHLTLALIWCIAAPMVVFAQLVDIPMRKLSEYSMLVIEGKVLSAESFWNQSASRIYTLYDIQVIDYLKGHSGNYLRVIGAGGCVANDCQTLYPKLELASGAEGIFFLRQFGEEDLGIPDLWRIVSGPLGFIEFHWVDGQVVGANALRIYQLDREVYLPIARRPKQSKDGYTVVHSIRSAPNIAEIFPDTLAAGVSDTLTIIGTEFGETRGKVWFQNADKPAGIYMRGEDPDIVSWTDTLIRVLVPSDASLDSLRRGVAGSGPVRVETSGGVIAESNDELIIRFAYRTRRVAFDSTAKTVLLISPEYSKSGGYEFRLDPNVTARPLAKEIFKRALRDWRCATKVNFSLGTDTVVRATGRDNNSVVYWDTLDPGVLGATLVDERFCRDNNLGIDYYQTYELDIKLDSNQITYVDTAMPGINESDFYSIVLHELGHGHLMEHVNQADSLMHPTITLGTTVRTISPFILEGTQRVMDSSLVSHNPSCPDPILPVAAVDCNLLSRDEANSIDYGKISVFPNPAFDRFTVEFELRTKKKDLEIRIVDLLGRNLCVERVGNIGPGTKIVPFEVNHLPNGYYLIQLSSQNGAVARSVLIQH
ncbi:MAG: T9SS type A sorting domain-containing protein [Bacteroidota bacterium]